MRLLIFALLLYIVALGLAGESDCETALQLHQSGYAVAVK